MGVLDQCYLPASANDAEQIVAAALRMTDIAQLPFANRPGTAIVGRLSPFVSPSQSLFKSALNGRLLVEQNVPEISCCIFS